MLSLSRTTGYAILAMSCMGDRRGSWLLAKDIVACTRIPGPYLSRVLHALGKSGLVLTKRGYRGGFALARPRNRITLLDVIEAVEGQACQDRCVLGLTECSDERGCPVHEFWKAERVKIRAKLRRISFADVAAFECGAREHLATCAVYRPPSVRTQAKKLKAGTARDESRRGGAQGRAVKRRHGPTKKARARKK